MKRWQRRLLWLAVFVAGLLFLISQLNLDEVNALFSQVRVSMILGVVACLAVSFLLWNLRWQYSLSKLTKIRFFTLLPMLMAGMFFNMVTPTAGMGGEPVRVYYLSKLSKARKTSMFVLTATEKLFGTVVLAVMLVFSLIFAAIFIPEEWIIKGVLIVLFLLLVFIIVLLARILRKIRIHESRYIQLIVKFAFKIRTFSRKFSSYGEFAQYVEARLEWAKTLLKRMLRNRQFVASNLLLTLAITIVNYLAFYLSLLAFNTSMPFLQVIVVFTIASVIADITFIPGGAGLTEAIAIGLYNAFGVPLAIAALATLLYRTLYYIFTIGAGYLCLVYLHMKE